MATLFRQRCSDKGNWHTLRFSRADWLFSNYWFKPLEQGDSVCLGTCEAVEGHTMCGMIRGHKGKYFQSLRLAHLHAIELERMAKHCAKEAMASH